MKSITSINAQKNEVNRLCGEYRAAPDAEKETRLLRLQAAAAQLLAPRLIILKGKYHIAQTAHEDMPDNAAHDLVQELADRPTTSPDNFANLLYASLDNRAIDVMRKVGRLRRYSSFTDVGDDATVENYAHHLHGKEMITHGDADIDKVAQDLRTAFSKVGVQHLEAFQLMTQGHTYEEIAKAQGIPVGTVKSRLHVVKKAIKALPGYDDDGEQVEAMSREERFILMERLHEALQDSIDMQHARGGRSRSKHNETPNGLAV
ncbi:MAG: RNA polymerase sigma factor [Proteobacteria bacterium]|nr:RNA polymerase sigma factor [Pseudomonadota bacterium]